MAKAKDNAAHSTLLNREAILGARDTLSEYVDVPEWGGAVKVRGLTAAERDAYETETIQRNGRNVKMNSRNLRARLVVLSVVDEEGNRLFSFHDIEALGDKAAKPVDRIFGVAMRLSGLREEDVAELAEDFGATPDGASSSA